MASTATGAPFTVVEVEVGSRCNRRCSYCPVSIDPNPAVPVRMTEGVYRTLVDQLAALRFDGRVSYHFYNEPLLRRDLERLVADMATRVPDALQVLYTNGDYLSDERYDHLRVAGIDYFIVTRHEAGDYPERPFQVVQYTEDLVITNRGGALEHLPTADKATATTPCFAPSEMLIVTVTGDVVLCYEDAHRRHVVGNITEQSVLEIWNGDRFRTWREAVAAGRRNVLDICRQCTNTAHAAPGQSVVDEPFAFDRRSEPRPLVELKAEASSARAAFVADIGCLGTA